MVALTVNLRLKTRQLNEKTWIWFFSRSLRKNIEIGVYIDLSAMQNNNEPKQKQKQKKKNWEK